MSHETKAEHAAEAKAEAKAEAIRMGGDSGHAKHKAKPDIRVKFHLDSISPAGAGGAGGEDLTFSAIAAGAKDAEANSFSDGTPTASLKIHVSNKAVLGRFKAGQLFNVELTAE